MTDAPQPAPPGSVADRILAGELDAPDATTLTAWFAGAADVWELVAAADRVGGPLDAHDTLSFTHPSITNEADWKQLLEKVWSDAGRFAALVEQLPDDHLHTDMADPKYGTWYRNLHGIIEHTHYHLGQIVVLKKVLRSEDQRMR